MTSTKNKMRLSANASRVFRLRELQLEKELGRMYLAGQLPEADVSTMRRAVAGMDALKPLPLP